ncbi:MAG: hypothetical protein IRZ00_03470 [Gemmatimonadetes bacterium]|nr:hypothetical protein [Gemmatimonadota bacterium]
MLNIGIFELIIILAVIWTIRSMVVSRGGREVGRRPGAADSIPPEPASRAELVQLQERVDELQSELAALREQQQFLERLLQRGPTPPAT